MWIPRSVEVHKELRALYTEAETMLKVASEIDFSDEIIQTNNLKQSNIVRFPSNVYWGCLVVLSRAATKQDGVRIPSTGFLTIYYVPHILKQRPLTIIGFSFEGWNGHPWHLEKIIVQEWADQGLLTLVPN